MSDYTIFKKFPTEEQAIALFNLLSDNGVQSVVANNIPPVDITFSGSTLQHQYEVRVKQSEFEKAEKILEQNAENIIDQIDSDHYLYEFSNDELYEILIKPDEWSTLDYTLAQKILKERGKSIDQDLLNSLKNERIRELAKPEEGQEPWIYAGYLFSFLGGFIGIIIGYTLWTSKKTLPNGEKVHSYSESNQKHGKYIFYIGLVTLTIALFLRFSDQF